MANDNWRTPQEVFNTLNSEFKFVADMASTKENALCNIFFTKKSNSLSFNWMYEIQMAMGHGLDVGHYVFVNPPYSKPLPWILKAREAQLNGLGVVMLLNADNSVRWFAEALKTASEIRFIVADIDSDKYESGRIAFIDADGNPSNQNSKPQMLLVFNPFAIGHCVTKYVKKSDLYKTQENQ